MINNVTLEDGGYGIFATHTFPKHHNITVYFGKRTKKRATDELCCLQVNPTKTIDVEENDGILLFWSSF